MLLLTINNFSELANDRAELNEKVITIVPKLNEKQNEACEAVCPIGQRRFRFWTIVLP